jgi:hypothetical protein
MSLGDFAKAPAAAPTRNRNISVVAQDKRIKLVPSETNIPRWGQLLRTFRRLEDHGEVRGGRFVSGFGGE